jgi:hypothetical protein
MISSIQLSQIFVYGDGEGAKVPKKLVLWPIILIACEWIFVLVIFFVELGGVKVNENISFLRAAGYCKALITFVKYMPQVRAIQFKRCRYT